MTYVSHKCDIKYSSIHARISETRVINDFSFVYFSGM